MSTTAKVATALFVPQTAEGVLAGSEIVRHDATARGNWRMGRVRHAVKPKTKNYFQSTNFSESTDELSPISRKNPPEDRRSYEKTAAEVSSAGEEGGGIIPDISQFL